MMKQTLTFASLAAATLLLVAPAQASIVCNVVNTPDGFVALRKLPTAASPRLFKLKPWHKVEVLPGGTATWVKVKGPVSSSVPKQGFVRKTLISDCG
jgi:hypothetical protein